MIFKETLIKSLSFAVRVSRFHTYAAFPTLFHTAGALSAPAGHLPLEGKAVDTRKTCHRKPSGIAIYENRRGASLRLSLPRMGKGDRGAVDRVLS